MKFIEGLRNVEGDTLMSREFQLLQATSAVTESQVRSTISPSFFWETLPILPKKLSRKIVTTSQFGNYSRFFSQVCS
jgi:hypothetical protein